MTEFGSSRHFAAMQRFSGFWGEADIEPFSVTFTAFTLALDYAPSLALLLLAALAARGFDLLKSRLVIVSQIPS